MGEIRRARTHTLGKRGKQNTRHDVNWLLLHLHMSERAMIFVSFVIFSSMQREIMRVVAMLLFEGK